MPKCSYCSLKTLEREMNLVGRYVKTIKDNGDLFVYIVKKPNQRILKNNWNRIYHGFKEECTCAESSL